MKVLLFSTGFPEYILELANALSKKCTVILAVPSNHKFTPRHIQMIDENIIFESFEVIFFKSLRRNIRMVVSIINIVRRHSPDILHIQSNGHPWFPLVYLFKPLHTKVVNTIHDPVKHIGDLVSLKLKDNWAVFFGKIFTKKYIVHGIYLKELLSKTYRISLTRIAVIPHGHFEIYKKFQQRIAYHEPVMFLFFGRIWPYKGLEFFIRAANKVITLKPHAQFVIAGSGEDIDKYRELARFPDNFNFHNNRIPMEEAGEFFQRASVVVLPYIEGTQSGVIPVAYAYGKPVIATRVGSIGEVVEEGITGFLVTPCSEDELAERMLFFIENPEKISEMGGNAYQKTKLELNWETIADETYHLYQSID